MKLFSRLGPIVLALTTFAALDVAADPIDYTHGMITGADIFGGAAQGIPIGTPVWDWIDNKEYTFQVVNSDRDKHESYVGLGPTNDYGFSSALATGSGDLEVGTRNEIRRPGGQRAVTRYNFGIKNNTDQAFTSGMNLYIDGGVMGVKGIRSDHTAHLRLEAVVEYVLLTPAGPFGGHYEETSGRLFTYFIDLGFDSRLTSSDNATVTLAERSDFLLAYIIDAYSQYLPLPDVPAYGELRVYYDMYAHLNIQRYEIGAYAQLGDPLNPTAGPGIQIVPGTAPVAPVPEPSTLALLGLGLIAGARRRGSRLLLPGAILRRRM